MRNLRLDIEYDGSRFSGFQRQPNQPVRTIQGELETTLSGILSEPIRVVVAGRTDAGVHAKGQVINFRTASKIHPAALQRALNRMFHGDLAVSQASEAGPCFHARHSAHSRLYEYLVHQAVEPPSLMAGYVWHVFRVLDVDRMQRAVGELSGRHDFRSFSSQGAHLDNSVRTVHRIELAPLPEVSTRPAVAERLQGAQTLRLTIEADAFLPHMVRMMVASIVRVGSGEWAPSRLAALLANPRNGAAGPPAPPQGLCLVEVRYNLAADGSRRSD